MRENRTYGSVRGALSDGRPLADADQLSADLDGSKIPPPQRPRREQGDHQSVAVCGVMRTPTCVRMASVICWKSVV
jgi:hypothetical protein